MNLSKAFQVILQKNIKNLTVVDVCGLISKKGLSTSKDDFKTLLKEYNINSIKEFKSQSLEILIKYIKVALNDNILTVEEKNNIRFLKLLFEIKEGDFKSNKTIYNDVKNIIKIQLELIYMDDSKIDTSEALHKVDLQEVFDLSYDTFLEISNHFDLIILGKELDNAGDDIDDQLDSFQDGLNKIDSFIDSKSLSKWSSERFEKWKKENSFQENEDNRSRRISERVKDRVWNRDGGKCVLCGSNENIEFDHIVPFSKGGANTYRNIQILCQDCNRKKSDNITIEEDFFDDDFDLNL